MSLVQWADGQQYSGYLSVSTASTCTTTDRPPGAPPKIWRRYASPARPHQVDDRCSSFLLCARADAPRYLVPDAPRYSSRHPYACLLMGAVRGSGGIRGRDNPLCIPGTPCQHYCNTLQQHAIAISPPCPVGDSVSCRSIARHRAAHPYTPYGAAPPHTRWGAKLQTQPKPPGQNPQNCPCQEPIK